MTRLVSFAVLALAGTLAALEPTFVARTITIPGGSNVLVTGINDSGTMVVNFTDINGTAHCVMIAGTTTTQIVDPHEVGTGPGKGTSCWGINNAGQVIGSSSLATWGQGFLFDGSTYLSIANPGATAGTTTYGLNNVGQVVGSFADDVGQHGFLYSVAANTFTTIDVPGAYATLAIGINDGGTITFEWLNNVFEYNGAAQQAGKIRILNVPGMAQSKARGINSHGQIVFNAVDTAGVWHGFLFTKGSFAQADVFGAADTYAFGVNSKRQMVGGYNPSSSPLTEVGYVGH